MKDWIEEKKLRKPQGELLFREGDAGEQMYVIIQGRILIFKTADGRRIELAQLEKGDFFGEMALLDRLPRTASAEVIDDAELLVISPADFDEMLKKNTEIAVRIMRKYSQRLRNMLKLLEEQRHTDFLTPVATPKGAGRGFESLLGNLKSVERGHLYPINAQQLLIGRRDAVTGIVPDIDLFEEDILNSVSRQHAWIDFRDGNLYLTEEVGVAGGTYVNEKRLVPGEAVPLKNGDRLRFGYVLLTYLFQELTMKLGQCIETSDALEDRLGLSPPDVNRVIEAYPMRITPLVERQIRREGGVGPISLQYVPDRLELEDSVGLVDPLAEEELSPVPNLVHRYPDRVLLLLTNECAVYCRFCTRKRRVGHPMDVPHGWLDAALDYIEQTKQIRDVLLSGGDPLLLSDAKLDRILARITAIKHVEIVRIGTRIPFVMPERVTPELVSVLRQRQPLYLMLHVNHPDELSPEAEAACLRLADAGIPLFAQTVLLRGVNDSSDTLRQLFHRLLRLRIRPYHLMQGDLTCGTDHFRTPVQVGLDILRDLQGHTTGFAIPALVVDLPGGGGKVTLAPDSVVEHSKNELVVRNYQGRVIHYPEPAERGGA